MAIWSVVLKVGWGERSEPQQQLTTLAFRSRNHVDLVLGFAALTPTYQRRTGFIALPDFASLRAA